MHASSSMQIRIPLLLLRSWLPLITLPQHQAFDSHGVSVYQCIINRALAGCIPRNRTRTRAAARLCAQRPQLVCAHKGRSWWSDACARRPTDDQRMTVRKAHQVVGQNWSDYVCMYVCMFVRLGWDNDGDFCPYLGASNKKLSPLTHAV